MNLNMLERLLRVIVGGLLISSAAFDKPFELTGWLLWLSALVGLGLVLTGIVGNCPVYAWMDRMAESGSKKAKPSKKKPAKKSRKTATKPAARRTAARKAKKAKSSKKKPSRRK